MYANDDYEERVRELNEFLDEYDFDAGKGQKRTRRWEMRLSEGEQAALDATAAIYGMTPAALVRRMCCADPRRKKRELLTQHDWRLAGDYVEYRAEVNRLKSELTRMRTDVARVGNNVNQIARAANAGVSVDESALRGAAHSLGSINAELRQLRERVDGLLVAYESLKPFAEE